MEPAVQKTDFASLYLLSEILREDSGTCGNPPPTNPKAGLRRTAPHIAELSSLVKTPDLANAVGDSVPHEMTYNILLVLVARSRDDDICLCNAAVLHKKAVGDDPINVLVVQKIDLSFDDQIRRADVEVVSAPASEVFHLIPGIVRFSVGSKAETPAPQAHRVTPRPPDF